MRFVTVELYRKSIPWLTATTHNHHHHNLYWNLTNKPQLITKKSIDNSQ